MVTKNMVTVVGKGHDDDDDKDDKKITFRNILISKFEGVRKISQQTTKIQI